MKLIITNTYTQALIGGKDNLLPFSVFKELDDYLKMRPSGYEWSPAYKKRFWDGWKRFINKKGVFATGFLPLVIPYMQELGVEMEVEDRRVNLPKMTKYFNSTLDSWELREYQEEMVMKYNNYIEYAQSKHLYFPRGILAAATNAGKNSIISGLIQNTVEPKCLVLIHRQEIHKQLVEFLSENHEVGVIDNKHMEFAPVTVAMVKTLHGRMDSVNVQKYLKSYFNILVVDECHHAGASQHSALIQQVDAGMRAFVSGTPLDNVDKVKNMYIIGLSGFVLAKISKKELMDKGHSLPVKVTFHLNNDADYGDLGGGYEFMRGHFIHSSERRCKIIGDILTNGDKKKTIITFIEKEHGDFMYDRLTSMRGLRHLNIEIVNGVDKDRKEKIENFRAGQYDVLLTSQIMAEGINIADINRLIYAQGGKATIPLSQFSGRIERQDGVSDHVELHDFWDTGKYLGSHSNKRRLFYMKEQFEIKYEYEATRAGRPKQSR